MFYKGCHKDPDRNSRKYIYSHTPTAMQRRENGEEHSASDIMGEEEEEEEE